ncbi:hypothetical protein ASE67_01480 [Sphingomonas sp. Leaf23]|uniref:phage major tail tube protein n=1 Tax=Sphingomonas sp. Leaf23 TaxID=1735689 RepID=UPI0006F62347|nr:phage major tail tube protein [Sphingomonas sp. Leaf23]KQM88458.1 hypothetical protein ASE67_01480 [Sphingomonas sp. Leaf23]
MAFPEKLKQADLFIDGRWVDEMTSVTLPKIGRKFEDFRGGGMNRPVKVDMGAEAMEAEWVVGGFVAALIGGFGAMSIEGQQLRFVATTQDDRTGAVHSWVAVIGGRHEEIDMGEFKSGEDTEMKGKTAVAFYSLHRDGVELVYIDVLGMVERYGGIDIMEAHRTALGRL